MNSKIVIFHFLPLEGYPPIQNLLNSSGLKEMSLYCLTTKGQHGFRYSSTFAKLYRCGLSDTKTSFSRLKRYLSYVLFNSFGLFYLLLNRPSKVVYYETLSSFPALAYKWLFPGVKLFILYHEYTSIKEYRASPIIVRILHKFESRMYPKAYWMSHTNSDRSKLFSEDYNIPLAEIKIVPNYPPESWANDKVEKRIKSNGFLRLVYVGYSLDRSTMFLDKLIDLIALNEQLSLDFYLLKTPQDFVDDVISRGLSHRVNWREGLAYNDLPLHLGAYDIGLILYKGTTENYRYNAPNKLFEYLVCGLSVWYPSTMLGVKPYRSHRVLEVDFERAETVKAIEYDNLENTNINYNNFTSEKALELLIKKLID